MSRELLGAPVILVVDGARPEPEHRGTAARVFDVRTTVRIAGVILNRVGSARHEEVLRQACAQVGVTVLGAIPAALAN